MSKTRDLNWVCKFEKIQIFREVFGHCNIPQRFEKDPSLGTWVSKQRSFLKNGYLDSGRKVLINKLDFFPLFPKNFYFFSRWNKHFLELCYFKKIYGHCNVPGNYTENISLGFWVKNQRQLLKKYKLEKYKIDLLRQIGFEMARRIESSKISWIDRYENLFNYFKKKGTTEIPQRDGSLGKWAQKQRDSLKKRQIKDKKLNLLLLIKFLFDLKDRNKPK